MNFLTSTITVISLGFPAYYLFIAVILIVCLFLLWYFGIRDGFDKERLFDLFFISAAVWYIFYRALVYFYPYDPFVQGNRYAIAQISYLLIALIFIRLFTFKWRWSVYRMLDIFSLVFFTLTVSLFVYKIIETGQLLGIAGVLVFSAAYIGIYIFKNRFFSGLPFSLYLLLTSIFGQFYYKTRVHLIFYFALITISMLTLTFRTKKAMFTRKLDINFIKKIKDLLGKKKERLEAEQKELIKEDPYLQEGRDMGNSEEMDEAILEDRAKIEADVKKENLEDMEKQVDKALDKIEEGEYGICEICGQPIDQARLEVYPEATTCVDCAEKQSA